MTEQPDPADHRRALAMLAHRLTGCAEGFDAALDEAVDAGRPTQTFLALCDVTSGVADQFLSSPTGVAAFREALAAIGRGHETPVLRIAAEAIAAHRDMNAERLAYAVRAANENDCAADLFGAIVDVNRLLLPMLATGPAVQAVRNTAASCAAAETDRNQQDKD